MFELVVTECTSRFAKITVSPSEGQVRLKIPSTFTPEDTKDLIEFTQFVVLPQSENVPVSIRGDVHYMEMGVIQCEAKTKNGGYRKTFTNQKLQF